MEKDAIRRLTKSAILEYNNSNPGFTYFKVMNNRVQVVKKVIPNAIYISQGYFKINN